MEIFHLQVQSCYDCHKHSHISSHSQAPYINAYEMVISTVKKFFSKWTVNKKTAHVDDRKAAQLATPPSLQGFQSIGSFELLVGDVLLYSKLLLERFPTAQQTRLVLSHYEQTLSKDLSVLQLDRFKIKQKGKQAAYPRSCVLSEIGLEGRDRPVSARPTKTYIKPYSHYGEKERVEVITRIYQLLKERQEPANPILVPRFLRDIQPIPTSLRLGPVHQSIKKTLHKNKDAKSKSFERILFKLTKETVPSRDHSVIKTNRNTGSKYNSEVYFNAPAKQFEQSCQQMKKQALGLEESASSHLPQEKTLPLPPLSTIRQVVSKSSTQTLPIPPIQETKQNHVKTQESFTSNFFKNMDKTKFAQTSPSFKRLQLHNLSSDRPNLLSVDGLRSTHRPFHSSSRSRLLGINPFQANLQNSNVYSVARQFIRQSKLRKQRPLASLYSCFAAEQSSRINQTTRNNQTLPNIDPNSSMAPLTTTQTPRNINSCEEPTALPEQTAVPEQIQINIKTGVSMMQSDDLSCCEERKEEDSQGNQRNFRDCMRCSEAIQTVDNVHNQCCQTGINTDKLRQSKELETSNKINIVQKQMSVQSLRQSGTTVKENQLLPPIQNQFGQRKSQVYQQRSSSQTNYSMASQRYSSFLKNKPIGQENHPFEPAYILQSIGQISNFRSNPYQETLISTDQFCDDTFLPTCPELPFQITLKRVHSADGQPLRLFPRQITDPVVSSSKNQQNFTKAINIVVMEGIEYISRLFENCKFVNRSGAYCVWLWNKNFQIVPILIDDKIPYDCQNKPVYSNSAPYIWLILLEKALAKMLGSYRKLHETNCFDIVKYLTGSPYAESITSNQKFMSKIGTKLNTGKTDHIYCSSNKGKLSRIFSFSQEENSGKGVFSIRSFDGKEQQITQSDFTRTMQTISILHLNLDFHFNQLTVPASKQSYICVQLFCQNPGKIYFTVSHQSEVGFCRVNLFKKLSAQTYKCVGEVSKYGSFYVETSATQGSYLCLYSFKDSQADRHLSFFSQSKVQIKQWDKAQLTESGIETNDSCFVEVNEKENMTNSSSFFNPKNSQVKNKKKSEISRNRKPLVKRVYKDQDDEDA